jgi:uncharacterized protein DUF6596
MHLHSARMPARQDGSGGLSLLEAQDRSRWDQEAIQHGLWWLARAAEGDVFSRYHAEAGEGLEPPSWLLGSYLWSPVLAELHRRCGHAALATQFRRAALDAAPCEAVRTALERRLREPSEIRRDTPGKAQPGEAPPWRPCSG